MAVIKKTKSAGEDVEKLAALCTVGGNAKWYSCYGKQYGSTSKIKNRTNMWSNTTTSGHLSKRIEIRILKKYLQSHVHCSPCHSIQDMQTTQRSIGFPGGSAGKEFTLQCGRPGFNPCVGKIPWRREWLIFWPTSVLWPGEFHGLIGVDGVAKSRT